MLFAVFILTGPFRIYSENSIFTSPCTTSGSDLNLIKIIESEFKNLKLSGAFLISQRGQVLAQGYCGSSNPKYAHAVTESTKFNIGSLTKQFTGYLLHELVQEKSISLTGLVSDYVPELRNHASGKLLSSS
jgi:CubicO group peptidase (beta-lactamase class C family)